jgi:hypothetical protein
MKAQAAEFAGPGLPVERVTGNRTRTVSLGTVQTFRPEQHSLWCTVKWKAYKDRRRLGQWHVIGTAGRLATP